jgi:hypothetical protein
MGDPHQLLRLEPEELAGHLVQELKSYTQPFHPTNIAISLEHKYPNFPELYNLKESVMEAFAWLVSETLVIHDFNSVGSTFYKLSKRAKQLKTPTDINDSASRKQNLL